MNKIFVLLLLTISAFTSHAQKDNFIYLQTDNRQPFYVQLDDKTLSSTESGYLILSKIKDSTISFTVGFAKNLFPEQQFTIKVDKTDLGFLLKNMGEKGWALFNLQTMELIPSTPKKDNSKAQLSGARKNDSFSVLLSNVVNDSIILYANNEAAVPVQIIQTAAITSPVADVKKKDTAAAVVNIKPDSNIIVTKIPPKADTLAVVAATVPKPPVEKPVKKDTVVASTPPLVVENPVVINKQKPVIKQLKSGLNKEQYSAYYIISANGITDTIDVFIPLEQPVQPVAVSVAEKKNTEIVAIDCPNIAGDNDVDKLRIQLMAVNNNVDKIAISRKSFQAKCYSTKQLKALTELFEDEQGKYLFYESAYPHTTDVENFPSLKTAFQSNFFRNKFAALIAK